MDTDSELIVGEEESKRGFDPREYVVKLTERDLEKAGWPVITYCTNENYLAQNARDLPFEPFWREVFKEEHFITPDRQSNYDPKTDKLFILHSFKDGRGVECVFKAVTTSEEELKNDPANAIDFNCHGRPCELRGGGSYPKCDFWRDFYDFLKGDLKDKYRIPDRGVRKRFWLSRFVRNV